jgi:Na+/pantothenate symporter
LNRVSLLACLLIGIVAYLGLRTLGWIAHGIVPGLALGAIIFVVLWVGGKLRA